MNTSDEPVTFYVSAQGWFSFLDDEQVADAEDDPGEVDPTLPPLDDPAAEVSEEAGDNEPLPGEEPAGVQGLAAYASGGRTNSFSSYDERHWNPCGLNDSKDKSVRAFSRKKVGGGGMVTGTGTLRCGTENYGYRHLIVRGHNDDFQAQAWKVSNRNWRAYADWTMNWTLAKPTKASFDNVRKTWCFSRPFYIYSDGQHVQTRWTIVILGETAQRIISAYPKSDRCSGTNRL